MRRLSLIAAALAAALCSVPAHAQQAQRLPPGVACGTAQPPTGMSPPYMDATGNLCTISGVGGSGASGTSGTPNEAAVSCGNTTTTLLAAGAATSFILIQNAGPTTAFVNVAGAAATATAASLSLTSGQSLTWSAASGYLPTSLISCIVASGSQSLTVVSK
jgi:hypothetical protein